MQESRAATWMVVVVVVLVALLLGLISLVMIGVDTGAVGFLIGFVMATVPVPFYVMFPLWLDRFEPEPWWLLALSFVWGAAIATFVALLFNTINIAMLTAAAGSAGDTLGALFSAPLVEELAKGLALLLLFLWQRDQFDNVTDGIVYAMMVGLGFAMTENVAYYGRAVAQGGGEAAGALFLFRGIMGPFAHPLFTSMTGIGLGAARESDKTWVKWLAPIAGVSCAMALHFLWNLSASFGALFFVMYLFVMVPAAIALLVVVFFSLRREARVVRLHLEAVAEEGILSFEDLAVLCSVPKRIRDSGGALLSGGFRAWRARRRFHRVATDFAFQSWRGSRGLSVEKEEVRDGLLAALRDARAQAGLEPVAAPPTEDRVRRLTSEIPVPKTSSVASGGSLRCSGGPLAGQAFEIGPAGIVIGRDPASAQVVVPDHRISKRHVWIGKREGGIVAIDRGSTNGTFLRGERIGEARLETGDRLVLAGATVFDVEA